MINGYEIQLRNQTRQAQARRIPTVLRSQQLEHRREHLAQNYRKRVETFVREVPLSFPGRVDERKREPGVPSGGGTAPTAVPGRIKRTPFAAERVLGRPANHRQELEVREGAHPGIALSLTVICVGVDEQQHVAPHRAYHSCG